MLKISHQVSSIVLVLVLCTHVTTDSTIEPNGTRSVRTQGWFASAQSPTLPPAEDVDAQETNNKTNASQFPDITTRSSVSRANNKAVNISILFFNVSAYNDSTTVSINFTLCDFYCSAEDNITEEDNTTTSNQGKVFTSTPMTTTENDNATNATTESPFAFANDPELCMLCAGTPAPPTKPPTALTLYYQRVTARVWRYCPPLLFIIGTAGNFLSALVMMRKALRTSMTSFFLVSLAVVDTFMLWTGLLRHYVGHVHAIYLRDYSSLGCKLHIFLVYWLGQYAAWILVSMTMERFFAIFSPHKAKQFITRTTCAVIVAACGLILGGVNLHFFFTFYKGDPYDYCTMYGRYEHFLARTWPWIDFAFFSFLPFAILIAANLGIILRIAHSNYVRKHSMKQSSGGVKMTSMTAILLTVSLMFLVTTAPISIYLVIEESIIRVLTPEEAALNALWWAVVVNISYLNHTCNFFLYCFSGPRFRRELRAMFSLYSKRVYPESVTQTVDNSVSKAAEPGAGGAENTVDTDV